MFPHPLALQTALKQACRKDLLGCGGVVHSSESVGWFAPVLLDWLIWARVSFCVRVFEYRGGRSSRHNFSQILINDIRSLHQQHKHAGPASSSTSAPEAHTDPAAAVHSAEAAASTRIDSPAVENKRDATTVSAVDLAAAGHKSPCSRPVALGSAAAVSPMDGQAPVQSQWICARDAELVWDAATRPLPLPETELTRYELRLDGMVCIYVVVDAWQAVVVMTVTQDA